MQRIIADPQVLSEAAVDFSKAVSARDAGPAMHALRAAAYAHPAVGVAVSGAGPDGVRLPR